MKAIVNALSKRFDLKGERKIKEVLSHFSLVEKLLFMFFVSIMTISAIILILNLNEHYKISIPSKGGTLTEGMIGSARFLNPVLSMSEVDRDLSSIIYSGLLKFEANGQIVNDLAQEHTTSEDKTIHTFKIRDDAVFHDGTPITSDDIIFTVQKFLDPVIKSPRRVILEGISVEKVDLKTVKFTLKKPFAGFTETMTFGILPKHIWENVSAENFPFSNYNIEPIGSGPYMFYEVTRDSGGILTGYKFKAFKKYVSGEPFITNLNIKFYPSEELMADDYLNGKIDGSGGLSFEKAKELSDEGKKIKTSDSARAFGLFFNPSNEILKFPEVKNALSLVINREEIIKKALLGYGKPIYGPFSFSKNDFTIDTTPSKLKNFDFDLASSTLAKAGWTKGTDGILEKKLSPTKKDSPVIKLEISLSTSDAKDLKTSAEIIKNEWEKLGAKVSLKIFEAGDLNQSVIRPRKYDILLFGQTTRKESDLYAYWHSSQRNDPGLNIAMYASAESDKILDEVYKGVYDDKNLTSKLEKWSEIIKTDLPAIFIFSPQYIYGMPDVEIGGMKNDWISRSSDRWNGINNWYIKTDNVWTIYEKIKKWTHQII